MLHISIVAALLPLVQHMTLRAGHFWPKGNNLNKLGHGGNTNFAIFASDRDGTA